MADQVYNYFKAKIMDGTIDLDTDTINVALLSSAYSVDIDTHHTWSDVSANEISGSGYSAGGQALSGKAVTVDDTDDEGVFDASDVTWGSSTITARYGVVYKDTGSAATSPLISLIDFTEEKSSSSGDFKVEWNSEGILNAN